MFKLIPWRKNRGDVAVGRDDHYSLANLRDEFNYIFNRFLGGRFWSDWPSLSQWDDIPSFEWDLGFKDEKNEFVFHADLPGFEPEDFDVKVSGNTLTISAEHEDEKKKKNGFSYRQGRFHRTFTLPHGVEKDKIDARYHSGVLEVHLPKSAQAKGRRIQVKAG